MVWSVGKMVTPMSIPGPYCGDDTRVNTLKVVIRPFRFAVQGGPLSDPVALREHARMIEDLGYDELFSFDHLGAVDPFLPLAIAAEVTTRLRFGPLVVNNEFHNPALLARTAATFDGLTGGRLVLGLGTGYARAEHDAASIELRPPGPRVTRFGESLTALRALLDHDASTMAGDHVTLTVDSLGVRPVQPHVPFLIGGHGRRVVSLAARHADIFQFTGLVHHPVSGEVSTAGFPIAEVEQRHAWLTDEARQLGRTDEIEVSALVQRIDLSDRWSASADEMADRIGVDRSTVDATPFVLFGTVDDVCEKLLGMREHLGVSHVVIRDAEAFAPVVARLAGS